MPLALAAWLLFAGLALIASTAPIAYGWEQWFGDRLGTSLSPGELGWRLGSPAVLTLAIAAAVVISFVRRVPVGLAIALCAIPAALLVELVVKPWVGRPSAGAAYEFPSGHVVGGTLVVVVLVAALWPRQPRHPAALVGLCVGAALLCGFDAITNQAHQLLDVLGAWAWVGAWCATAVALVEFVAPGAPDRTAPRELDMP